MLNCLGLRTNKCHIISYRYDYNIRIPQTLILEFKIDLNGEMIGRHFSWEYFELNQKNMKLLKLERDNTILCFNFEIEYEKQKESYFSIHSKIYDIEDHFIFEL